ncbi:MAG: hypothetical protein R3B70_00715 [Polyangiaceae bacterium]
MTPPARTAPLLPSTRSLLRASLWLALAITALAACSIDRTVEHEGGVHPEGFAYKTNPAFHGKLLKDTGYDMSDCRSCHGDDYGGGPVGFSCNQAGCHVNGVEWCGTCHDGKSPPEPETGGHPAHPFDCGSCHRVPQSAREYAHPNGKVAVTPKGLAEAGGATPVWNPDDRRCQNTYCHGPESPDWDSPTGPLPCDACHGAPPDTHAPFAVAVAAAPEGCSPCHPLPGDPAHLDGHLDFTEPTCSQCHGSTPDGAPPRALDGATSPESRGVGAHARHLDATLFDRIGRPAECDDCHEVPKDTRAEGHIDDSPPAGVRLWDGDYDPQTASCVVACHWNQAPGPVWTDTSGAPRACDACHGFPPLVTRKGTPHPAVAADLPTCQLCHHFEPATHVDGHVDFLP